MPNLTPFHSVSPPKHSSHRLENAIAFVLGTTILAVSTWIAVPADFRVEVFFAAMTVVLILQPKD